MKRSVLTKRRVAAIVGVAVASCLGAGVIAAARVERASSRNRTRAVALNQAVASAIDDTRRARFTPATGDVDPETPTTQVATASVAEAPAGFDNLTNGFENQTQFNRDMAAFEEVEVISDGLGPTYNAQSCRECHQNVVTGGASQITEQRTGHLTGGTFFDSQGGSLIQSRATYPEAMELVAPQDAIRTFRISTNTLGAGFVEAIANATLQSIQASQPLAMRGSTVVVPVLEANARARFGRFGWKDQHASLESFAADAYLNEMGITSPLLPKENSSSGRDPGPYDPVKDPEDDGDDVKAFANFMRATKVPSRGPITAAVQAGGKVFSQIGCVVCHVDSVTTAPTGTSINGGTLTVDKALGNKTIHPYSDFLMHDINTGDGIPIQPTPEFAETANKIRTAPLWALRTRNRLMHDGLSFTRQEAILRHGGQAAGVIALYRRLSDTDQANLMAFLNSL